MCLTVERKPDRRWKSPTELYYIIVFFRGCITLERKEEKRREERERETRDKKETLLVLLFYNENFLKFFDIFHTLNKRIRGAGSFSFQSAFACVHSSLSLSRQNTKQRHHHRASQNKELENNKKTKKTFFTTRLIVLRRLKRTREHVFTTTSL